MQPGSARDAADRLNDGRVRFLTGGGRRHLRAQVRAASLGERAGIDVQLR